MPDRAVDDLIDENERLREALRGMLDVAGAMHVVVEGPNAGWRGDPLDGYYEEDHVPAPDCLVCAAEKGAREVLDA